jgi:hypothetical protein
MEDATLQDTRIRWNDAEWITIAAQANRDYPQLKLLDEDTASKDFPGLTAQQVY